MQRFANRVNARFIENRTKYNKSDTKSEKLCYFMKNGIRVPATFLRRGAGIKFPKETPKQ